MPESDGQSYSFPRAKRLTRGPEIEHVRKEGKRVRTSSLEVRATASLHSFPRVGVVVPRYGHSAVDRNRVKRQLRELIRQDVLPSLPAMDVVLKAAPKGYDRSFDELREEVRKMARQLSSQAGDIARRPAVPRDSEAARTPDHARNVGANEPTEPPRS